MPRNQKKLILKYLSITIIKDNLPLEKILNCNKSVADKAGWTGRIGATEHEGDRETATTELSWQGRPIGWFLLTDNDIQTPTNGVHEMTWNP